MRFFHVCRFDIESSVFVPPTVIVDLTSKEAFVSADYRCCGYFEKVVIPGMEAVRYGSRVL
jgi:hypothetical protein